MVELKLDKFLLDCLDDRKDGIVVKPLFEDVDVKGGDD